MLADAALASARRHLRNGELARALQIYRQAEANGGLTPELGIELAVTELANGEAGAARDTLSRLLARGPSEPFRARAALLLATAEIELGTWRGVPDRVDPSSAPDGLADLAALRRAQAAFNGGDSQAARAELGRPELGKSTNRLLLDQGGRLAEQAGDPGLAADLYVEAARYPAWTADRTRLIVSAAIAYLKSGRPVAAIEQYRRLIEGYTWTKLAEQAGGDLDRIGGLTPYQRGLLALAARRDDAARAAFAEAAAAGGAQADAAARQLKALDETAAWRSASDAGTVEAFRAFRASYPNGAHAAEARFQEGLAHYQAGRMPDALGVWDGAVGASGDEAARLSLWAGKTLERLGRDTDARARWRAAAEVRPAGYYALRAGDLLAGARGWPVQAGARLVSVTPQGAGARAEAAQWVAGWAGPTRAPDGAEERIRRGLGLLALGLDAEAAAEFDGLIEESQDARLLLRLAELLAERELWSSSTRAASRLIALSPAKTPAAAPVSARRLAYPMAYSDLIGTEAGRRGLDPLLMLALIRQESRYDPFALSVADARGLTQVIPATGRGIAAGLGRSSFRPEDLYRPAVAVEFGAKYLAEQLGSFGGDSFRAIAAYNAGPGPIPRWAATDPDLFVERIDYAETRGYLRQVYVNHAIYRGLSQER